MVTIVICYQKGTALMLSACLASIVRHTKDVPYLIEILTKQGDADDALGVLALDYPDIRIHEIPIPLGESSKIHGALLDSFIPSSIATKYVMTLDSDCFPVADGWLSDLLDMLGKGAHISGILHPWAPPPADMKKTKIEWRVRSQHCWETTHVACQLTHTSCLQLLQVKYNMGDDTGLTVPMEAKKRGWIIDGFKVSRCAKPVVGKIDPEFNRYVSLVFGDKVYHHGGFSRTTTLGDEPMFDSEFGWVRDRILNDKGAEFLLDDSVSYRFKFDREEDVAVEKMQRLFGLKSQRMG